MTSKKNKSIVNENSEHSSDVSDVNLKNLLLGTNDLSSEIESVEGHVSEIANEKSSENSSGASGAKKDDSAVKTVADQDLEERILLRENLLAHAPKPALMKKEIKSVLEKNREIIEKDIRKYNRSKNYDLLSQAIAQLRSVIHQLDLVASASYDLLKEIWLKVVHRFA